VICSDGAGGAVTAWTDYRPASGTAVYARRVDGSGTPMWAADGLLIATGHDQSSAKLLPDGSGGVFITYYDSQNGGEGYAQRVDASGSLLWGAGGVPMTNNPASQGALGLIADGQGGFIAGLSDYRNGAPDVYAQRMDGSGIVQWSAAGEPICECAGSQFGGALVPDGAGGGIALWYGEPGVDDLYAQRLNGSGTTLWTAGGVAISTADQRQRPTDALGDGAGGAVLIWNDWRNFPDGDYDIYVQSVNGNGELGGPTASAHDFDRLSILFVDPASPNPFRDATDVRFSLDRESTVSASIYDVTGGLVRNLYDKTLPAGSHHLSWDGLSRSGERSAPGLYFLRLATPERSQSVKLLLGE